MPGTILSIFIDLFLSKYLSVFLLEMESIMWTTPLQTPARWSFHSTGETGVMKESHGCIIATVPSDVGGRPLETVLKAVFQSSPMCQAHVTLTTTV